MSDPCGACCRTEEGLRGWPAAIPVHGAHGLNWCPCVCHSWAGQIQDAEEAGQ